MYFKALHEFLLFSFVVITDVPGPNTALIVGVVIGSIVVIVAAVVLVVLLRRFSGKKGKKYNIELILHFYMPERISGILCYTPWRPSIHPSVR
jgi:uncharacterized membrane protein